MDPRTRAVTPDNSDCRLIGEILADERIEKVFHNAKFDVRMLAGLGLPTRGVVHDTMFMAHICNTQEPTFGLKPLAKKYLAFPDDDEEALKKLVRRLRNKAKKQGWKIAYDEGVNAQGDPVKKSCVEADYWLPRAFDPADQTCAVYNRRDTERTMGLFEFYQYGLDQVGQREIYEREQRLWYVTYELEERGVRVDPEEVKRQIETFHDELKNWLGVLRSKPYGGPSFNPDSNAQLQRLFFQKLRIPVKKYTEKGAPKVDVMSLGEHLKHPAVDALFRYRACRNGLVNFFRKYDRLRVLGADGVWAIHPNFQQLGPVTGRFSCREPNLQNVANAITTRSPMPIQARIPFGPRPGYRWYLIDYSQLEVRIFADVADEAMMKQALAEGKDLHAACANKAWGGREREAAYRAAFHTLELDGAHDGAHMLETEVWKKWKITPANVRSLTDARKREIVADWLEPFDWQVVEAEATIGKKLSRSKAKLILFAKVFGGGPNAIKDLLFCTYAEAKQFLRDYDEAMPGIAAYIKATSRQAAEDGFIVNRFGRRLGVDRQHAYRAVNYMVQGSAADLMKIVMERVHRYLRGSGLDAHLVLTVHDELIFEVRHEHASFRLLRKLKELMEDHGGAFSIPLPVEVSRARQSWNLKEGVEV